jgi:ABC-type transport system involved in multi-copper enzyme maturation permease subunit
MKKTSFRTLFRIFKQINAIATVTFHELLREKILWSAFVFAVLCVGLAYAVSQLSFADNARIAVDFGLTSVSIVGGLISIIMGAALVAKEIQNRTLYLVLTKSIWRWQFVLGKFAGLIAVLALNSLLMSVVLIAVQLVTGGSPDQTLFKSLLLQMMEFGVLASMACIFSAFSTSTLAAIFASGVWVIGHAMSDLRILSEKIEPPFMRPVLGAISYILPDLTRFDIKAQVAHQLPVTWLYTSMTMAYGFAYLAFALAASCVIFMRRDL